MAGKKKSSFICTHTPVFHCSLKTQKLPSSFSLLQTEMQEATSRNPSWRCPLWECAGVEVPPPNAHNAERSRGPTESGFCTRVALPIAASLQLLYSPTVTKALIENSPTDSIFIKAKHWKQPNCPSTVEGVVNSHNGWDAKEQWECTPHNSMHAVRKHEVKWKKTLMKKSILINLHKAQKQAKSNDMIQRFILRWWNCKEKQRGWLPKTKEHGFLLEGGKEKVSKVKKYEGLALRRLILLVLDLGGGYLYKCFMHGYSVAGHVRLFATL